jgi:hypothetical protein
LPRKLSGCRIGDLYPDQRGVPDDFIALDGETQVGLVKLVPAPIGVQWMWSMTLVRPGPAFGRPTNSLCQTQGQAARELASAGPPSGPMGSTDRY